jgi:hypothetical protein
MGSVGSARRGAALVACALVLSSCAASDPASAPPDSAERAGEPLSAVDIHHGYGSVSVDGGFTLSESRDLVDYRLQVPPGSVSSAIFWPDGWDYGMDGEPPAHPHLPAGKTMYFMANLIPRCDGSTIQASDPAVLVRSTTADGEPVEDRFTLPADLVNDAWNDFCDVGVSAYSGNMRGSADLAEVSVLYEITNPGPEDVTVTSQPWNAGDGRWLSASVAVPAGERRTLRVKGLDVCHGPGADGPIFMGLLVSTVHDEKPLPVTNTEEGMDGHGVCANLQ